MNDPGVTDDDVSLEAFRAEVRAFIAAELPSELRARVERGYAFLSRDDHTLWQKKLAARGWGAPGWPVEYGGTGWSAAQIQVFDDECARASCPRTQPQGLKMLAPILIAYGTPEQKRRFLPPILTADEWWTQGYSEPGAGSDLAALSTKAVRDGDGYRVTGQKIWTSLAHWADWMFCLVRTDATGKPQQGVSFLLIDMRSPGVTVRPIKLIDGGAHFNEVFLDDVWVPIENRVGEEGRGWTYAKALLNHERAGIAEIGKSCERLERARRLLADTSINAAGWLGEDALRERLALLEIEILAAEATTVRIMEESAEPALASILKLRGSEISQSLSAMNVEVLGPHALRFDLDQARTAPAPDDPLPSPAIGRSAEYLYWRALTIAGGSSEVQRNIIARRAFRD